MNTTAEKYAVPNANAVIHGPILLPPNTKSLTLLVFLEVITPIETMTAAYTTTTISVMI